MAIGLEHLRGPNGEQWTGMSPPQQRSQWPQQPKSPQPGVQTSMGNFRNLQAYQHQQDAFVQQHLKNQSQYNQGLQSGQSPQRVPVMEAWKQAGDNIKSGQYQGNPFQTGNVDALMGLFGQYGIQAPAGFRDQLLQNLGQQSAPPMYQPQPQMGYPGGPMGRPDLMPSVPVQDRVPDSWVLQMPQSSRPNVPPGWSVRDLGRGFYSITTPGQSEADVAAWASQSGATNLSPNRVIGHPGRLDRPQPQMTYPGGPMPPMAPGYGERIGLPPGSGVTMDFRDRDGDNIDDRDQRGPGQPPTAVYGQPPQAPAAPNPSDPWSYPLRPGHTRGPNGEQIMTREAREAEIRRMEQESGRTYVRPKSGVTQGGWLPPAKKNPGASISLNPEQAAAMQQYMASRQSGQAQPTPPRTQGTPYRGRRR